MKHATAALFLSFAIIGFSSIPGLAPATTVTANAAVFISPEHVTLEVGQFVPLTVVTADGDVVHDVVLTLTEPSVAELDSDAVRPGGARHGVRGRTPGSTYVTASTSRGVARASVKVIGKAW